MANDLNDFLQRTSIYLPKSDMPALTEPLPLFDIIHQIHGHILDFGDGPTVHFKINDDVSEITIGKLGTYAFPTTPEALTQVSIRLQALSQTPRFINAIQGLWPA